MLLNQNMMILKVEVEAPEAQAVDDSAQGPTPNVDLPSHGRKSILELLRPWVKRVERRVIRNPLCCSP